MELSCESVTVSFADEMQFIKCDCTNLKDQPGLEAMLSWPEQNNDICSHKDIDDNGNVLITELSEGKNAVLPRYSVNEMINVCYAKMWRGNSNCLEEDELCDSATSKVFPSYFEKDVDKLQKVKLKSKCKTRRNIENDEIKKWIETPAKFRNFLTDIRDERNGRRMKPESDDYSDIKGSVNAEIQISNKATERFSSIDRGDKYKTKNQVHFPGHVLLCAALQEDEPKEVEKIVRDYKINLNELSQSTGYHYLHKTIGNSQLNCAKILIQNGIDVNGKDTEGNSPLALAFCSMNFRMVALLVDSGANLSDHTNRKINELEKAKELSRSILKVFEMKF